MGERPEERKEGSCYAEYPVRQLMSRERQRGRLVGEKNIGWIRRKRRVDAVSLLPIPCKASDKMKVSI